MTTPSNTVSISNAASELLIAVTGLSMNDSRVRALGDNGGGQIAMSALRNRSYGRMTSTTVSTGQTSIESGYRASGPAYGSIAGGVVNGLQVVGIYNTNNPIGFKVTLSSVGGVSQGHFAYINIDGQKRNTSQVQAFDGFTWTWSSQPSFGDGVHNIYMA